MIYGIGVHDLGSDLCGTDDEKALTAERTAFRPAGRSNLVINISHEYIVHSRLEDVNIDALY